MFNIQFEVHSRYLSLIPKQYDLSSQCKYFHNELKKLWIQFHATGESDIVPREKRIITLSTFKFPPQRRADIYFMLKGEFLSWFHYKRLRYNFSTWENWVFSNTYKLHLYQNSRFFSNKEKDQIQHFLRTSKHLCQDKIVLGLFYWETIWSAEFLEKNQLDNLDNHKNLIFPIYSLTGVLGH